jgi:hypothetical protein
MGPLKQKEIERKRESGRRVLRNTKFNGGIKNETFPAVKVPRQFPLVLLTKAG